MATTASASPTVERSSSRRHQSSAAPSRAQSTRSKPVAPLPSPSRTQSSHHHHHSSSRHGAVEEVLPQANYETSNVAQTSRRSSSKDRPISSRTESARTASSHHRPSHSRYSSDMTTTATNGGGPAPVVTPQETRQSGKSGKSRTTIPASTGNWVLGKTIGAGSMGKVKLARRVEGGEQVNIQKGTIILCTAN